jgi:hypothetical protein
MKKTLMILFCLVFPLAIFQACNSEGSAGNIKILSVTPNSGLTDGVAENFVVEVEYELSGSSQGELSVGFNTDFIDSFTLVISETVIIDEGSGQHTFNPTNITAKDWSPTGDFKAYVNISEYPHDSSWSPLDSDTMILTF